MRSITISLVSATSSFTVGEDEAFICSPHQSPTRSAHQSSSFSIESGGVGADGKMISAEGLGGVMADMRQMFQLLLREHTTAISSMKAEMKADIRAMMAQVSLGVLDSGMTFLLQRIV